MIESWIDYLLAIPGDLINYLDSCLLFDSISVLQILVVAIVAGIITSTFLAVARRK